MATVDLAEASRLVRARRLQVPPQRALLVAVTGIDGSGKGFVSEALAERLRAAQLNTALLHGDGWLHLPKKRFGVTEPAQHFYHHAFRFDAMFEQLVLPLRDQRSWAVKVDHTDETAVEYRKQAYDFRDVDVVLLEAIFLLKREYRAHYDLAFWVDCTTDTALERALSRRQEGLDVTETIRAYQTVYFPAQRIHLERDDPRAAATAVIINDKGDIVL